MDRLAQEIAFSMAKGIHGGTAQEILDRVDGVEHFFNLSMAELHNLTGIKSDIFDDEYRKNILMLGQKEADRTREKHIDVLFMGNNDYPQRLYNCEDAPVVLYRYGSCTLEQAHCVGIVGTRHSTAMGIDFTTRLVEELAKRIDDLVIISGLAYGIDVAAHKAALATGVPTVGVLAHGLSRIYPAEHRQIAAKMASSGGALVSEYTYETLPQKSHFLSRNRIIASLSDCVIVVESDIRGGAMSTARNALQYNKEVFAVPGRVNDTYSRGTNRLIANHTAQLITCASDVIEYMGWKEKEQEKEVAPQLFRPLTEDENQIVDFLRANEDATINDICVRLGKSYSAVSDIILQLEMDDILLTKPGGRYEIVGC